MPAQTTTAPGADHEAQIMMARSLYARIALVFAAIVLTLGFALTWVGYAAAKRHQHEILQRVSLGLAAHIAGQPGLIGDEAASARLFADLTAVNPNIEVYLLDAQGRVLRSAVPPSSLARERVALRPIRALLDGASLPQRGENPLHREGDEIFSAAPIIGTDGVRGYVYIVLLNDMYRDMVAETWRGYALRSIGWIAAAAVAMAMLAGLIAFAAITRRLERTIDEIESFARTALKESDDADPPLVAAHGNEIDRLSSAFGSMRTRLLSQMEELRRQDELRRELVANVSHDLRTPLTSMQGYLETLVRMDATLTAAERRGYLDVAVRQSHRVSRLSQQLFELARLECEDALPQPELFSISELVHDIAQKFALSAQYKSIRMTTRIDGDGLLVHADIGMIERAIGNLVENAIRHTAEHGEIVLSARARGRGTEVRSEKNRQRIPTKHLPGLLERGSTLRRMAAQRGGGLGLLIANRILSLHGSAIQAASQLGEGTSIGFVLPAPQAA
jgi:signal transduction histidine kinase